MNLKNNELFQWLELKEMIHRKDKKERIRIIIDYMNKFFGCLTQTQTPATIVCKVFNHEEKKCDVIQMTPRDFFSQMQNKRVKLGGKVQNLAQFWLNHERRKEYNGIIYSPEPLGEIERLYLNKYTGFKYEKMNPNPFTTPEGDPRGNVNLRIYIQHLKKICGKPE